MKKIIKSLLKTSAAVLAAAALTGAGGVMLASSGCKSKPAGTVESQGEADEAKVYTCPMHPEIKQSEPGKCPKCGMDLELVEHEHAQ
ncbi:MAG: heavy metal-binding domain-containing protein [Pseudomonadota bacterium]